MDLNTTQVPFTSITVFGRSFQHVAEALPKHVVMFLSHVFFEEQPPPVGNLATGCWLWMDSTDGHGYGAASFRGYGTNKAHRIAWLLFRGPIPAGMHLHHLCERPQCVCPEHLLPVTPREHVTEYTPQAITSIQRDQTHCCRGHELSGENLYIYPGTTKRRCRKCYQEWAQRRAEMHKTPRPERTQCRNGHDVTKDENVYIYKSIRFCRACHEKNMQVYQERIAKEPKLTPAERGIRPHQGEWTHCKHGHEFTSENTLTIRGSRRCKICYAAQVLRSTEKRRGRRCEAKAKRMVCKRGHDLSDPASVYLTPDGRRSCRACLAMRKEIRRQNAAA